MKKKSIILIITIIVGILITVGLVLSMDKIRSIFSGAASKQKPQGVRVTNVSANSATIVWQTPSVVAGQIEYGTTPGSFLLRASETTQKTNHNLTLSPLLPETIYYFRIRINEEIYDENGAPYSFTTKSTKQKMINPSESPSQAQYSIPTLKPVTPTSPPVTTSPALPTVATTTKYTLSDFAEKFGSSDTVFDINNDGTVNSADWALYQQQNPSN